MFLSSLNYLKDVSIVLREIHLDVSSECNVLNYIEVY